jgi:hypothetical protein
VSKAFQKQVSFMDFSNVRYVQIIGQCLYSKEITPNDQTNLATQKNYQSRVAPTNALWIDQPDYQEHSVVFAKLQSLSNLRSDKQRFIFISGRMRKRKDEGKEI